MKKTNQDWNKRISDAAYLLDELKALKGVISAIPSRERPLEQESIMDMIVKIGFVQSVYLEPLLADLVHQPDFNKPLQPENNPRFDMEAFSGTYFDPSEYDDSGTEEIIDNLLKTRSVLISDLKNIPDAALQRDIILKQGDKRLYDILGDMVRFERNQMKRVAERVLSIETERHTRPAPN